MGTRGMVFYKNENNKYNGLYVSYDADIEILGTILINNYKEEKEIKKLIDLKSVDGVSNTSEETKKKFLDKDNIDDDFVELVTNFDFDFEENKIKKFMNEWDFEYLYYWDSIKQEWMVYWFVFNNFKPLSELI